MRDRISSPSVATVLLAALSSIGPASAAAEILPAAHRTTWNPGVPGGVPFRTTVCATLAASTWLDGLLDATAGIQAAIDACPTGGVVSLSAGTFLVNGEHPITIGHGVVLRGAGASATRLVRTNPFLSNPVVLIGVRWPAERPSVDLAADAAKGATSVQVATTTGFAPGQLVLLDETTDDSYVYWGTDPAVAPGGEGRGWFTRYDRPVGQMLEIAGVDGNTVSFTTPLHIAFDVAHRAQLTGFTVPFGAKGAGLEDLYVKGGQDDNITLRLALHSWVKGVESDWSTGDSIGVDSSLRCTIRDSYFHDTPNPYPGGAGYLLAVDRYTADTLVENNVFVGGNKVMVMRASGGGNVVAYNYFDDGYIEYYPGWMETGLNASHLTCPHLELFEGNHAFNMDGDDTWGGAVSNTFFRNHATGKRRSFLDLDSRRAAGLMYGHYNYNFLGNVLGTAGQDPSPYGGFVYEDLWPWASDPVPMWRLGYTPLDWNAAPDPRVVASTHRHGNFDYATGAVQWAPGFDEALPDSLYLPSRPAFFADHPWPWVDPLGTTKLHTLPAKARHDAGRPVGEPIFADGFQTGDVSRWSGAALGGGDLGVTPAAALALTLNGLQASVNDRAGLYVQDDSPAAEDRFYARFEFDPNGFDPGEAARRYRTRIFVAFGGSPVRRLIALVLRRQGGVYALMGRCRLDNGFQASTGFVPITDGPHAIAIEWRRASGLLGLDGSCRFSVDGVPLPPLLALDNGLRPLDFVRLGALSVKPGASGSMFWDEYESHRTPPR
jgi:hypothetical protein